MRLLCAFLAAANLAWPACAQQPERIPVVAWGGPPASETTSERYRELAEAGFTHNYSGYPNADAMSAALDIAHAAGVKQLILSLIHI